MTNPETVTERRKANKKEIRQELKQREKELFLSNREIIDAIIEETLLGLDEYEKFLKEKILQKFKPEDGHILIMGVPGAGKTTQGKHLAEILGIPFISTGDLLREEVEKKTPLGLEVKAYMDKGELVPDELIIARVEKELNGEEMCIVDGFPRTPTQAENNPDFARKAIALNLEDKVAIKRLGKRKGKKGQKRDDDQPQVIIDRVTNYHKTTEPVIQMYREKGALIEVNQEKYDKDWMVFANLIAKLIAEDK